MKYHNALKQILMQTRSYWDQDRMRPQVRRVFRKTLDCQTLSLGAEVYASANQQLIVNHTCKSPTCPSCGHRATIQWQRERWAALPDIPYKGITFTMPKEFWELFRDNRPLTNALPAIAAGVMEAWVGAKYGLRVGVIAILHTFNGRLEFNSHVHAMISAGGLQGSSGSWVPSVYYDKDLLMSFWRGAVIKLLREASRTGLFKAEFSPLQLAAMLTEQSERRWIIKIQSFKSKEHFLRYAGRYVRRPPIAQRRITSIGTRSVTFWAKDKKLGQRVHIHCSPEEFIDLWAHHIREHYQHAIRYFGLFAPRAANQTASAIFSMLGQKQRPRPRRIAWAESIKRDFGYDPLLDKKGYRMKWAGRLRPEGHQ